MFRSLFALGLFVVALATCRPQPEVDAARGTDAARAADTAAVEPAPIPAAPLEADAVPFDAIRFIQLQRSEDSATFYTQDDCRCTQQTAEFRSPQRLTFATCDSVYPEGDYRVRIARRDSAGGLTVFATHRDSADTIVFRRTAIAPAIYEIRRSNSYDIESGLHFISALDSAKFEHRSWDCSEYGG